MKVLDVAQIVALEKAIEKAGLPLAKLMDRAGAALADAVRFFVRDARLETTSTRILVLAGSGNNGGDGWVAAELLARDGFLVSLVATRAAGDLTAQPAASAAKRTMEAIRHEALPIKVRIAPKTEELMGLLDDTDVVIDALLGTGFSGENLREPYATWIALANEHREKRGDALPSLHLAADVPSGLSAQEGTAASPTFKADATVTMLACKPGLLVPQAQDFVGALSVAPLGVDLEVQD